MAILEVLSYPDKFLTQSAKPIEKIDNKIHKLINDMAETMYASSGLGLAGPQVGIDKSIIIYDISPQDEERHLQALINPKIVFSQGSVTSAQEGCLSVPDFRADVKRAEKVRVIGMDTDGQPVDIEADGTLSVVLQHEIDHLNGILLVDRVSSLKRQLYKKKVKNKLKKIMGKSK